MRHPFRRYCFHLAEKLHRPIGEILALSSDEISEWMAFELTKSDEWTKNYNKEVELAQQKQMSSEMKKKLFMKLLGGN